MANLAKGIEQAAKDAGVPVQVSQEGSMFGCYLLREPGARITSYATARRYADTERYARFFHAQLDGGIYFTPSQFEAGFVCTAHTADDIRTTVAAAANAFARDPLACI